MCNVVFMKLLRDIKKKCTIEVGLHVSYKISLRIENPKRQKKFLAIVQRSSDSKDIPNKTIIRPFIAYPLR